MSAALRACVRRHPALTYFALTFAISTGGLIALVGPTHLIGTPEEFERLFPIALSILVLGPVVGSLVSTWLVGGRAALRELGRRLLEWRVAARWYAVALLTAPVYFLAIGLAVGAHFHEATPAIFVSDDKLGLVASGMASALVAGIVEELGWTGFATPTLLKRYRATATGVIVGAAWGAWHVLPKIWGADAHAMLPYLPVDLLSAFVGLIGFRILMTWVYARTQSLLIGILMHVGLTAATLILQAPVDAAYAKLLVRVGLVLSAAPWLIIGGVAIVRAARARTPHRMLHTSA